MSFLILFQKKTNVNGNICDLLENYDFLKKYEKQNAKEFDSKFDNNHEEKTEYVNNELNMLPIHEELSKIDLFKSRMDFDATSSFPSAMWDEKSVYPKIEIGYAFTLHMNDVFVNEFNNQTFNQDGNDSAFLKTKKITVQQILYFNISLLKKKLKTKKLIEWERVVSLTH